MASLSAFSAKPKNVKFDSQEKGEKILFLLRRHGITNMPWIIIAAVLSTLPVVFFRSIDLRALPEQIPFGFIPVMVTSWYLITLGFCFESFLNWYFNVDIITNKRIVDIEFWGILYRRVSELEYSNVEDVTYTVSGLPATIFNYGDVFIQTAAEKREFEFHAIPRPDLIHDKITDLVQKV